MAPTEIYTLSLHDALPISALKGLPFEALAKKGEASGVEAAWRRREGAGRCRRRRPGTATGFRQRGNAIGGSRDRKSTRLNSSHLGISYAVFCLKKKKYNQR